MSMFSRLFTSPQKRQLEQAYAKARQQADKEFSPLAHLGTAIITASTNCRDSVKCFIALLEEKERMQREIFIFYEFLYFFMHLTNRHAFKELTTAEMKKLQEYLGPLVSSVAIDADFAHWPENLKNNMTGEFYEKLNTAEVEYTKAGEGGGANALINLFATLGHNVCALATDNDANQDLIGVTRDGAFDEWSRLEFYRLIADVKHGFAS